MDLKTPVRNADRSCKMYANRLEKLNIKTLEDFLYHVPSRYEDFSLISTIAKAQPGEVVTIQGKVLEIKNVFTKGYKKLQKAKVEDETGVIEIIWFNQPFLTKYLHKDDFVSLSGRIGQFQNRPVLESPDYELMGNDQSSIVNTKSSMECIHTGRLVPIYPETHGVSSKWLRRQINKILKEQKQNLLEYLPDSIVKDSGMLSFNKAIEQIHFPDNIDLSEKSRSRLAFDELFLIQLSAQQRKDEWKKSMKGNSFSIDKSKKDIEKFWEHLPFELTFAQKKAVDNIFQDLTLPQPMNRLLEGDVGSGKTVVAAAAMYIAFLNGFQSVLMAPTEILAQQHYNTISTLLSPFGVGVQLFTSSSKPTMNKDLRLKVKENRKSLIVNRKSPINIDIAIGTHALIHERIKFKNLGLVVIDEQQRFGVEQRSIIRKKGNNPHFLTMTATPIPRTIALTFYGDLDLSYLDEMPIGRKKVKTWLVPEFKRENAYFWIKEQIKTTNSQAFIICPFIEESESMQTIKAATKEFERLQKEIFKDFKLGLLHGKLKGKLKDEILTDFKNKKFDILVATPVVEVGIDIPNATIIVIEASERFGLSQLHQLRGRVGRADKQSFCLLFTESKTEESIKRLKAMESMNDGANLAEYDLKLRGAGEIYGTLQHGRKFLKFASFSDRALIEKTREAAKKIFPQINKYPLLMEKLKEITIKQVSPD